jgi:hypothetical protein
MSTNRLMILLEILKSNLKDILTFIYYITAYIQKKNEEIYQLFAVFN